MCACFPLSQIFSRLYWPQWRPVSSFSRVTWLACETLTNADNPHKKLLKGTTTNNPEVFLTLLSIQYLNPFSHATGKTKDAFVSFYPLVGCPNCMPEVNLQLSILSLSQTFQEKKILTVRIDHIDHKVSLHVWYLTCSSWAIGPALKAEKKYSITRWDNTITKNPCMHATTVKDFIAQMLLPPIRVHVNLPR